MKGDKTSQIVFWIVGFLLLLSSVLISIVSLTFGKFPAGHEIMLFGLSIVSLCNAYLYPQFKANDERSKRIREKGMFVSYFFIMGYILVLMLLFEFNVLLLNGYQTVCVLATLIMITVFSSFVVLSKRY